MKTPDFAGKSQMCQMLWRTSVISRENLKTLIFLFQSLLSFKVSRVKPELQILQDIPAGCFKHSRSLEKSCLDLEFCRETLMSFYALASLRNQNISLKQTQPFCHLNRKIKKLREKHKNNSTTWPGETSQFPEAVKYFSKTENESGLLGTSASWLLELNRQQETLQTQGSLSSKMQRMNLST